MDANDSCTANGSVMRCFPRRLPEGSARRHRGRAGHVRLLVAAIGLPALVVIGMFGYWIGLRPKSNAPPESLGFVLACQGDWLGNGNADCLRDGAQVYAGQTIAPKNPQEPGWIEIHFRDGSCQTYTTSEQLPAVEASALQQRLLDRLQHRYFLETAEAMARGEQETGELTDAVVRQDANEVDVSVAVRRLPVGDYYVQWAPVSLASDEATGSRSVKAESAKIIEFAHDPEKAARLPVPSAGAGLYRFVVFRDPENEATQQQCLLLVASADQYPQLHAMFEQAASRLEARGHPDQQVSKTTRGRFLRAYLVCLAESMKE